MKDHCLIDQRSLAFDRIVVARLRENPALVDKARSNLQRWMTTASPGARKTLCEWESLIEGPFEKLIDVIASSDDRATRLRQSSPFCGIISDAERLLILKEFHKHDENSA